MDTLLKPYLQYQKPQVYLLGALFFPLLGAIYNFGWRVLLFTLLTMFVCWGTEYWFTRKEGKPASAAALVTGALLALIVPPNVPYWQIAVGGFFCIVFGKMAFGGFGRNVFNPAMVGRCFLYICFPATVAAAWFAPFSGGAAGFTAYTPAQEARTRAVESSLYSLDAVTSATTLATTKRLNQILRQAMSEGNQETSTKALSALDQVPLGRLFLGNINGSQGETSGLLILLSMIFLLYHKILAIPLLAGPLLGMFAGNVFTKLIGVDQGPFLHGFATAILAGGTFFACVFMTTEPITAPSDNTAKWLYGILIGFLSVVIRSMSAFNGGFMFAILLGNTFGPLLEMGCLALAGRGKETSG